MIRFLKENKCLLFLIIAGGCLRIYCIDSESIWIDEAYSLHYVSRDLNGMLKYIISHDANPPLYYLLLKLWLMFFSFFSGEINEFVLRLPSAVFGIFVIPVAWFTVKENHGKMVAFLVSMIVCFSMAAVWYSQEARVYSFQLFFAGLHIMYFLRFLSGRGSDSVNGFFIVITSSGLLYSHHTGSFFIAAEALFMLILLLSRSKNLKTKSLFKKWIFFQIIVFIAYLPFSPYFFQQLSLVNSSFWLKTPVLRDLFDVIYFLFVFKTDVFAAKILMIPVFVIILYVSLKDYKNRNTVYLLCMLVIPFFLSFIISLLITPVMLDRTLIVCLFPLACLAGITFKRLQFLFTRNWRFLSGTFFILLVILTLFNLYTCFLENGKVSKTDFRKASEIVSKVATSRSLVVFPNAMSKKAFDFYFKEKSHVSDIRILSLPVEVNDIEGPVTGLEPKIKKTDIVILKNEFSSVDRVILILNHDWYTDPESMVKNYIASKMCFFESYSLYDIEILVFDN